MRSVETTVLLVAIIDDDPSYGRAAARLLRASGMQARTFSSAEEYLEVGRSIPARCLLVDVHLGGMSGFDLQGLLVSVGSPPPVVFISGDDEESIAARAAEAGCAFVRKSDPGDEVLAAIRRAVEGATLPH